MSEEEVQQPPADMEDEPAYEDINSSSDFSDDQPEAKRLRRSASSTQLEETKEFEPGDYVYFSSSDSEKPTEAAENGDSSDTTKHSVSGSGDSSDSEADESNRRGRTSSTNHHRRSSCLNASIYTRRLRVSILAVIPSPSPPDMTETESSGGHERAGARRERTDRNLHFSERLHQLFEDSEWSNGSKSSASDHGPEAENDADDQVYEMEFEVASVSESELNTNPIEDAESSSGVDDERLNQGREELPETEVHNFSSGDAENFADEESDASIISDNYMSGSELEKKWPCHQCKTMTHAVSRFCLRCFRIRRNWLPKRPPRKGRGKAKVKQDRKTSNSDHLSSDSERNNNLDNPTKPQIVEADSIPEDITEENAILIPSCSTLEGDFVQSLSGVSNSFQSVSNFQSATTNANTASQNIPCSDTSQYNACVSSSDNAVGVPTVSDVTTQESKKNLRVAEYFLNREARELQSDQPDQSKTSESALCDFCFEREKSAAFVHNKIAHQCCCYPCAHKILKKTGKCPICRERILRVVKVISA